MTSVRAAIVATVVLCGSVAAVAGTNEEAFLGVFKKFGVTNSDATSKKPCLCMGGGNNGQAGTLVIFRSESTYSYECSISIFNQNGDAIGFTNCLALGGSVVVLSK